IRSRPVVPVLIGDAVPKRNGEFIHDEEYYRHLLLLFKPWRAYDDLRSNEISWKEAFDRTDFSPYCRSLIADMEVDAECREARVLNGTV
ncbi:hypothetical protein L210DRAFT_3307599, partial [Boletus edulis BED1]